MNYGDVLSRAWQLVRRFKVLWVFGILASCGTTNLGSSGARYSFDSSDLPFDIQQPNIQLTQTQITLLVTLVLIAIATFILLAIFLGTIGRIGLIRGAAQADAEATRITFTDIFNGSLPYFWRVFALNLLVWVAVPILAAIVIVVLAVSLVGLVCLIPLLCLLAPLGWVLNILIEQAHLAMVLENRGVFDGLSRGWEVFKNNLGPILVVGLILFAISLVAGLILGIPFTLIVLPAVMGVAMGQQALAQGSLLLTGLCLIAYVPVAIFLNGILQAYIQSTWSLAYLRLTGRSASQVL